jgi:hypothetical protein
MKGEKTFLKENIPAFSVQRKSRSISVLQKNLVTIIQDLWMIVTRFFCKTEILRDFLCTLKAGIFSFKKVFSPFINKRI